MLWFPRVCFLQGAGRSLADLCQLPGGRQGLAWLQTQIHLTFWIADLGGQRERPGGRRPGAPRNRGRGLAWPRLLQAAAGNSPQCHFALASPPAVPRKLMRVRGRPRDAVETVGAKRERKEK